MRISRSRERVCRGLDQAWARYFAAELSCMVGL